MASGWASRTENGATTSRTVDDRSGADPDEPSEDDGADNDTSDDDATHDDDTSDDDGQVTMEDYL